MRLAPLQPVLIWHNYLFGWVCGCFASVWLAASIIVFFILICFDKRLWITQRLLIITAVFAAGFFYCKFTFNDITEKGDQIPDWGEYNPDENSPNLCGKIRHVQGLPNYRMRILLDNLKPAHNPQNLSLQGITALTWDNPENITPLAGQTICVSGKLRHFGGFANNKEFYLYPLSQKILWRLWITQDKNMPKLYGNADFLAELREKLRRKFLFSLHYNEKSKLPQSKAILLALLFGDKSALSQETMERFSKGTLAHSLALSGQHLCIAGFFALCIICGSARLFPRLYLFHSKMSLICLASVPLAFLYLWIGNAPPSLARAACMLFAVSFFLWRKSVYSGIDVLITALAILLFLQPLIIFDAGLQLSVLCVLVIILSCPALANFWHNFNHRPGILKIIPKNLCQIFFISLLIQIFMLPVTLAYFQNAGFLFPLNLLWLPLLAAWTLPLAFAGLIFSAIPLCSAIAAFLLETASLPCKFILFVLELLENTGLLMEPTLLHPHWTVLLAFGLIGIALSWINGNTEQQKKKKQSIAMIICGLLLLCTGPVLREIAWHDQVISLEVLDVGQGQALLLKFPENGRIIIDGGGSSSPRFDPGKKIVSPVLSKNAAPRLSAVISTHPDIDHLGGLFYILDNYHVPYLFHNGQQGNHSLQTKWEETQNQNNANILKTGDILVLGNPENDLKLEILHPPANNDSTWTGNSASIVLRLSHKGKGLALLTGDAEKDTLKHISSQNKDISAEVVIAPHHGSNRSLVAEFYKKASPKLVAASCGFENRYNYPGEKLKTFLANNGIALADTGNNGKITIQFNDKTVIKTTKGKEPEIK